MCLRPIQIESDPVVEDLDPEALAAKVDSDLHHSRCRVPLHVVERLLRDTVGAELDSGIQAPDLSNHVEGNFESVALAEFLRQPPQSGNETEVVKRWGAQAARYVTKVLDRDGQDSIAFSQVTDDRRRLSVRGVFDSPE